MEAGGLTDQSLPLAIALRDFVHTAHLAVGHPSDDEHNDPGPRLDLGGTSVLVPVTVACTAEREKIYITAQLHCYFYLCLYWLLIILFCLYFSLYLC